ncbi:hypothetical protein NO1_0787 [Candidatus Termititenax aidoneus]|uniref:SGNH/GDSL hydrolase family protein n=1 Tax=Termititenax aidoneus TaxID=2218524 RepID=A0A388T9S2_TERA1|nr:hypothetical protein NO1_0787 [Candidatus Termititenax aidoneus]
MKKLLLKLMLLFLPFLLFLTILVFWATYSYSYHLAILDKYQMLKNTTSPKLVLVGGSNLAFGIDSQLLEKELQIPVVNTGVSAGFGLGRMLDSVLPFLNSGDILLISPEYSLFSNAWNGDTAACELIFAARQYHLLIHPGYYDFPKDFLKYISDRSSVRFFTQTEPASVDAYTRDGFNQHGDYIKHLNKEAKEFSALGRAGEANKRYINRFFRFVDKISARGVFVLLTYPPFASASFNNSRQLIQELDKLFKAKENLVVISSPSEYFLDESFFYDSPYHLNAAGRKIRTTHLIKDLHKFIDNQ